MIEPKYQTTIFQILTNLKISSEKNCELEEIYCPRHLAFEISLMIGPRFGKSFF